MQTPTAEKPSGWDEAFDRSAPETNRPEKPEHVLNARQLEFIAHIKRTQKQERPGVLV